MAAVLGQCPACVDPEDKSFIFIFVVLMFFYVPRSFVQACAVTAVENHHMVLSLGQSAIWLSFRACGVLDT